MIERENVLTYKPTCPTQTKREKMMVPSLKGEEMKDDTNQKNKENSTCNFHFHLYIQIKTQNRCGCWLSYLIPKTLSSKNPPKKQRITLGQEYQAYSCMNFEVFRFRSCCSQWANTFRVLVCTARLDVKSKKNNVVRVGLLGLGSFEISVLLKSCDL